MRAGEAAQATDVLENARAQAVKTGAKTEEASALFYLGVAQQARIQTEQLPDNEKRAARAAAISAYEQSLAVNSTSGPALNNLAQLYRADPARRAEADALLAKAINLDDSRKGVYLLNRAALKRETGDIPAALKLAEQAAAADRANLEAHHMVVDVALASESAAPLLAYLKDLNAAGLVARALDAAADGLQSFPGDRVKLLVSIGESLGNSAYTAWPPRFPATNAGKNVQQYRDDPAIGAGVRELLAILKEPMPTQSISWWRRGHSDHQRISPESPSAIMQSLTRRCGEIYRSAGDPANLRLAEAYYRMAVDLSGPGTDPRAFVALAEILFNSNRVDEVAQILRRYESQLLETKGMAIAQSDYRQIYELRLALGMMYAYTKRWVNPQTTFAGAIWMLEAAQRSAADYNRGVPVADQIGLPPSAVKMLSAGYSETGKLSRSVTVRLDAADRYLAASQPERAAEVLDEIWRRSLPADLESTLTRRLKSTLELIRNPS
ncbi:MAG TPA: hypothetical protein VK864_06370 [Longimicrobiales bacterium]|nr:hypothetical protein [Longimicrobiales bacterium]